MIDSVTHGKDVTKTLSPYEVCRTYHYIIHLYIML